MHVYKNCVPVVLKLVPCGTIADDCPLGAVRRPEKPTVQLLLWKGTQHNYSEQFPSGRRLTLFLDLMTLESFKAAALTKRNTKPALPAVVSQ
jgi:hypothetical protein